MGPRLVQVRTVVITAGVALAVVTSCGCGQKADPNDSSEAMLRQAQQESAQAQDRADETNAASDDVRSVRSRGK